VEEDQQRLAAGAIGVGARDDDLDRLVGTDVAAVDRQVNDLGTVPVGWGEDGESEDHVEDADGGQGDRQKGRPTPAPDLAGGRTIGARATARHLA